MTHKVTLAGRFRKRLSPLFLSVMFNGNILHPFIQWVIFAYSHAPPKNVIARSVFFLFRHIEQSLISSVIARSVETKQSLDSAFAINILQMDHRGGLQPSS